MTSARSQYFQHIYSDYSTIGNGVTTKVTGDGNLLAGTISGPGFSYISLVVTRTDVNGKFTSANNFNNSYTFFDNTGRPLSITSSRVLEFTDKTGYGVVGSFFFESSPNIKVFGLFYVRLDLFGNIITCQGYETAFLINAIDAASVYESTSTPGNIFATGTLVGPSESFYFWAFRIRQNGTLTWGNVYSLGSYVYATDLIESPYASELVLVGGVGTTGSNEGYWVTVNPLNGAVLYTHTFDLGAMEYISAISLNSNPASKGFILSGTTTFIRGISKAWVFTANQNGTVIYWSKIYDDLTMVGYSLADIKQRLNTISGQYEYYTVGGRAIVGTTDVMVFKLDQNGFVVPSGMFLYNTADSSETGVSIDIDLAGIADGIGIYAHDLNTLTGIPKMLIIKADFLGRSGCNQTFMNATTINAPITLAGPGVGIAAKFKPRTILKNTIVTNNNEELCFGPALRTIATGVNALDPAFDDDLKIYPNPAENNLHISGIPFNDTEVSLSLFDISGRLLAIKIVEPGEQDISISTQHLEAGTYILRMKGADGSKEMKFIKQ